jgi:hypothetical protein
MGIMIIRSVVEVTHVIEVNCKSGRLGTAGISMSGLARLLAANPEWDCTVDAGPRGAMVANVTRRVVRFVASPTLETRMT